MALVEMLQAESSVVAGDQITSFRRTARGFLLAANIATFIAVTVLALTIAVIIVRGRFLSEAVWVRLGFSWAPALFYLAALLFARRLFAILAEEGFSFGAAVVQALRRIGFALGCGGLLSFVWGSYLMLSGIRGVSGFASIAAPGLTIGILGAALVAIARLIGHGEAIRRQNTSLSAELEGFV